MCKSRVFFCIIVLLTLITTIAGIFYTDGGSSFVVENIYGQPVTLYGDGIYKYNSLLKAAGNKGTDIVMLGVALVFCIFTFIKTKNVKLDFSRTGLLMGLFYYSTCLVFSVTFNEFFLVYVLLFSITLFCLIISVIKIIQNDNVPTEIIEKKFNGTAIFLLCCASSVLIWLQFIIPAILNNQPLSIIEIYTTEPTFVLDLGIIFPLYLGCGIGLIKKNKIAYKLTPILLTFIVIVGLTVLAQSMMQMSIGINIPINQLMGLVISFVVLGLFSTILNVKFLKHF